jgi:hypothetical protein
VAILPVPATRPFCAGADLKTYIPALFADASPTAVRELVELGLNGFTRGMHPSTSRSSPRSTAGPRRWARDRARVRHQDRLRTGDVRLVRGPPGFHHGDGGIVRLVNTCRTRIALEMLLTAEPIDAERALRCNLVSRVVRHERPMEEAELLAHQILRNSQRAVRSAKQTVLDVIGQPLDQLRTEAWNAYTCANRDETLERLDRFYGRADPGRVGRRETASNSHRRSGPADRPSIE